MHNISVLEKAFSKMDKDEQKEIGKEIDDHFNKLSKKDKSFSKLLKKIKSEFGVKDFNYKSIKKILNNKDYLKKLLIHEHLSLQIYQVALPPGLLKFYYQLMISLF